MGRFKRAFALLLAALLVLLAACGAKAPEPVTFRYRDRILTAAEGVPVNEYAAEAFSAVDGVVTYADAAQYGIDVSSYQGNIDWQAVKGDGIDFAIIRAGYRGYGADGLLHEDANFAANIEGALAAGLDVGVYIFSQALTRQEAEEEAQLLIDLTAPYADRVTYPAAFDWELVPGVDARTDQIDMSTLSDVAEAFCAKVSGAGYRPAVYFNRDLGYLSYDIGKIAAYDLWLAELSEAPDFYYEFQIWQYSHTGQVAGIFGNVDRNIAFYPKKQ